MRALESSSKQQATVGAALLAALAACHAPRAAESMHRRETVTVRRSAGRAAQFVVTDAAAAPTMCEPLVENAGWIRVHAAGTRPLSLVAHDCRLPTAGELCPAIDFVAFAGDVREQLQARGITADVVEMGACNEAHPGTIESQHSGIVITDWGNANVAVATVSAALAQWNISSDVFVSVMDRSTFIVD